MFQVMVKTIKIRNKNQKNMMNVLSNIIFTLMTLKNEKKKVCVSFDLALFIFTLELKKKTKRS